MWHCAWGSCTSSQSIELFFGGALFWYWVSLCVTFTNSLIECYFAMMVAAIWGIFMTYSFWSTHLGFLSGSVDTHPPGRFCPCIFEYMYWIEHVTFGLLYVMFRFSTRISYVGEFLALQLTVVLRCLVPWINHLPPVGWSTFWKSSWKW